MYRIVFVCMLAGMSLASNAQTKKTTPNTAANSETLSAVVDTGLVKEEEPPIPSGFTVYTKRYKTKMPKMRLCLNLVNGDTVFNYCIIDSLLRDPEKTKLLFQKRDADSTFALVYVMAFTKDLERPECSAGRETKIYFARISNTNNKGIVKFRYIESCYKTITRLNRDPIEEWDGTTPLKISYNRGSKFLDMSFDPQNYKLGLQSNSEGESK